MTERYHEYFWRVPLALVLVGGMYELLGVGFESVLIFPPFFCLLAFALSFGKVTNDVTRATAREAKERRRFRREGIPILRIERKMRKRRGGPVGADSPARVTEGLLPNRPGSDG